MRCFRVLDSLYAKCSCVEVGLGSQMSQELLKPVCAWTCSLDFFFSLMKVSVIFGTCS